MSTVNICAREFEVGAVYAPKVAALRRLPRRLAEVLIGPGGGQTIIYCRADAALTVRRWCTPRTWADWAGERVEAPRVKQDGRGR